MLKKRNLFVLLAVLLCSMNAWSYTFTNNYTIEAKFKINAIAAGIAFRASDVNASICMWQYNVGTNGDQSKFRPHDWSVSGILLEEKGTGDVTLNTTDWFETKIVISDNGKKANTYLRKVGDGDYVLIDADRSGTFTYGYVGAREDHDGSTNESATFDYIKVTDNASGVILYSEDFNVTNGNWTNNPTWNETDGTLTVEGRNLSEVKYFPNNMYKENMHYTVEADMKIVSGYISLVFGLTDSGSSFMWQISPNYNNGSSAIVYYHFDKGNESWYSHGDGSSFPDFSGSDMLGTKRHVMIEVEGNVVKTYIDGSLEYTYTVEDLVQLGMLNPGRIGVRADAGNSIHHEGYIDNLRVTEYDAYGNATLVMLEDFNNSESHYFNMTSGASIESVDGDPALHIDVSSGMVRLIQGSLPNAGHDYYLYNIGSGLWLQNNDRRTDQYTTRAELGYRGMNVGVSAITGGYKLDPYFGNNHSINASNLYMDTSVDVTAWTISPVSGTHCVTIKSGDNFLGSDGTANDYLTVGSSLAGGNSYWKMYTASEYYDVRKTEMLTATQVNPKDATWMITNPNFPFNDERENDWTKEWTTGNNLLGGDGGVMCNRVWESWNAPSHSMTQTLEKLPAGVYRMSIQGYYNQTTPLPYYFIQNTTSEKVQHYFMLRSDGEHTSTNGCATIPGNLDQASKCIFEGHYVNPWIYFVVGEDNEATTIGVKREGQNGQDWLVYDNFKLEYLGTGYTLEFNENNTSIDEFVGRATHITTTRSMKANVWNTFCVPFPMTAEQIEDQLGDAAEVMELTGAVQNGENYTMTFSGASSIEAGKPYMVRVPSAVSSIELDDAGGLAVNTTGTPAVTKDGVTFHGTYVNGLAPEGSFIISDNVFYNVNSEVTLKGFRGYITVDDGVGVKALEYLFDDDATLLIDLKDFNGFKDSNDLIYNLAGQRVSKMQKGINIVNGKKIIK